MYLVHENQLHVSLLAGSNTPPNNVCAVLDGSTMEVQESGGGGAI